MPGKSGLRPYEGMGGMRGFTWQTHKQLLPTSSPQETILGNLSPGRGIWRTVDTMLSCKSEWSNLSQAKGSLTLQCIRGYTPRGLPLASPSSGCRLEYPVTSWVEGGWS